MKLLLHICCAPCSTATVESWRQDGADISGMFFNPNIQPFREQRRRYDTLLAYASKIDLPLVGEPLYDIVGWLDSVHGKEQKGIRCRVCIGSRMRQTAELAAARGYDAFSTSLLVSPWQEHEIIVEEGGAAADAAGVEFAYRDLRPRYRRSVELSREAGMYRQNYCGCIFSEYEAALERNQNPSA